MVADRLNKLRTDIEDTYQAITEIGGTIPSDKNTNNIPEAIRSVYDNLPKVSDTGTNVSLSPTLKGRLGIVQKGNTYQESTTGKNILNLGNVSGTASNVSYSVEKGKLKLNGTCNSDRITISLPTQSALNGTYTFSTNYTSYNIALKNSSYDNLFITTTSVSATVNDTITQMVIYSSNGTTYNNQLIELQLESGSSRTPFEPYTNGASPNPDYPQEIQSATGTQKVVVSGKNLFDKDNTVVGWIRSNNGTINPESGSHTSNFIKIKPNTNYIRTTREGNAFYDENKEFISYTYGNNYETPNNAKYIRITVTDVNINQEQLEKGNTPTPYQPYQSQNYTISLGNIELNKIGDYQDYISKESGNWVLYKNIGKVVLDGSEDWGYQNGVFRYSLSSILQQDTRTASIIVKCNYYNGIKTDYRNTIANNNNSIAKVVGANVQLAIADSRYNDTTIADFKTWLSTHNTEVLYVLAEPEPTPITDTNLVSQLNELYYLMSYDDTTNIDVTGNLPMRITASAIKGA